MGVCVGTVRWLVGVGAGAAGVGVDPTAVPAVVVPVTPAAVRVTAAEAVLPLRGCAAAGVVVDGWGSGAAGCAWPAPGQPGTDPGPTPVKPASRARTATTSTRPPTDPATTNSRRRRPVPSTKTGSPPGLLACTLVPCLARRRSAPPGRSGSSAHLSVPGGPVPFRRFPGAGGPEPPRAIPLRVWAGRRPGSLISGRVTVSTAASTAVAPGAARMARCRGARGRVRRGGICRRTPYRRRAEQRLTERCHTRLTAGRHGQRVTVLWRHRRAGRVLTFGIPGPAQPQRGRVGRTGGGTDRRRGRAGRRRRQHRSGDAGLPGAGGPCTCIGSRHAQRREHPVRTLLRPGRKATRLRRQRGTTDRQNCHSGRHLHRDSPGSQRYPRTASSLRHTRWHGTAIRRGEPGHCRPFTSQLLF